MGVEFPPTGILISLVNSAEASLLLNAGGFFFCEVAGSKWPFDYLEMLSFSGAESWGSQCDTVTADQQPLLDSIFS